MLIDMGGATTDVYSASANTLSDTVLHGVPEPFVKRTVEGDLGMRVSAVVVGESTQELVNVVFAHQPQRQEAFTATCAIWSLSRIICRSTRKKKYFDTVLAGCASATPANATRAPKAGLHLRGQRRFTDGPRSDPVRKVVGSGGWLSRASGFDIHRWLKYRELDDDGRRILLPTGLIITAMQKACFRCWQTLPGSTPSSPLAPAFTV